MPSAKWTQPNSTTQDAASYKSALETAALINQPVAGAFNVRAADTPSNAVVVEGLPYYNGQSYVMASQQTISAIPAPTATPRIDVIEMDPNNGLVYHKAGTEAASPLIPLPTTGRVPLAYYQLAVGVSIITNAMINPVRSPMWAAVMRTLTANLNTAGPAGFYSINSAGVGLPGAGGWDVIQSQHAFSLDDHRTQLAMSTTTDDVRIRRITAGVPGLWRKVRNSGDGAASGWGTNWDVVAFGFLGATAQNLLDGNVYVVCNLYHDNTNWHFQVGGAATVVVYQLNGGVQEFVSTTTGVAGAIAVLTQVRAVNSAGVQTVGLIPLARMASIDLFGSVFSPAGNMTNLLLIGGSAAHSFYQISTHNNGAGILIAYGSAAGATTAILPGVHVYVYKNGADVALRIANNSAIGVTVFYKVYRLLES